jgi:putative transposase
MKTMFTAKELAALALPGLPSSKRGINIRANAERWEGRKRQGAKGGAVEYPIEALPTEARAELVARNLPELAASVIEPARQTPVLTLASLAPTARGRAEARLCAVHLADAYRARVGIRETDADKRFADEWNAGRVDAEGWLRDALPTLSGSSLRRWRIALAAGDAAGLGGKYKGDRSTGLVEGNPVMRDFVIAQIAHGPHLKPGAVRDAMKARFKGLHIPSCKTLERWMKRWREENPRGAEMLANPDSAKNLYRASFGSQSERVIRINQVWESDATPADAMCTDGRFALVGMIDVFTRRARVLVTKTSKAAAVMALTRRCIIDWGFPEELKTDNGQEFKSRWVTSGLAAAAIEHRLCPPFTPEGKPHIERFFGTMTRKLFEMLPGYVGHSVADRQAIRARAAFSSRLGESDAEIFNVRLSSAQLQQACDAYLAGIYELDDHEGLDGMKPAEVAAMHADAARRIVDPRALDVLLAEPASGGQRVVGKRGVAVDAGFYIHEALVPLIGQRVQVRFDAADAGRIIVHDLAGAFVCVAEDPERTGASRAEIAAKARTAQQQIDRTFREAARIAKRTHRPERSIAEILDDATTRARANLAVIPAIEHDSAALREAAKAADALEAPRAWEPRVIDNAPACEEPAQAKAIDWNDVHDLAGWSLAQVAAAPEAAFFQWVAQNRDTAEPHHIEEFETAMTDPVWKGIVQARLETVARMRGAETQTAAGLGPAAVA